MTPDGPVSRAGIRAGDILLAVEDVKVQQDWHVRREVRNAATAAVESGTTGLLQVRLRLWRDGSPFDAVVNVEVSEPDGNDGVDLGAEFED